MKSRHLEIAEAALIVAALRTQGAMRGANTELCHSLSKEIMEGYVFVVDDEQDALLLADLIGEPVGNAPFIVKESLFERTIESDLLEDR